jgi:hypothetical protein
MPWKRKRRRSVGYFGYVSDADGYLRKLASGS